MRHRKLPWRFCESVQTYRTPSGHKAQFNRATIRHKFEPWTSRKRLDRKELAEREGFEPSVQVLARTTV